MLQTNRLNSGLDPISLQDLDILTPDLDAATIDDLAFRLMGFSGELLEWECARLAGAMLDAMVAQGGPLGRLEHLVVLALVRAAVAKATQTTVGWA